jgi:hypothetical protein
MKTFFLNTNHLVRSVSNQYFDVKICNRIYINNTYMTHGHFFLKTNHLVRDTPVSNQYFHVKICRGMHMLDLKCFSHEKSHGKGHTSL